MFFAGNIFGAHTGLFTTYQGIDPLPTQGGGSFALATTPLQPRSFPFNTRSAANNTPNRFLRRLVLVFRHLPAKPPPR